MSPLRPLWAVIVVLLVIVGFLLTTAWLINQYSVIGRPPVQPTKWWQKLLP